MKHLMILVPNLRGGGQERVAALTSVVLEKDYKIFFVVFNGSQFKEKVWDRFHPFFWPHCKSGKLPVESR